MQTMYGDYLSNLKELTQKFSKYQKVLLVYSSLASDDEVNSIYEAIRGEVVFNKIQLELFSSELISDGYRMVIFLCSGSELLNINYSSEEFINIYIPLKNEILPFYSLIKSEDRGYILFKNNDLDIFVYCFLEFHKIMFKLYSFKETNIELWTNYNYDDLDLVNSIKALNQNIYKSKMIDIDFIKYFNLDYSTLACVELIILNGYKRLILDIASNCLKMVDVFKFHKDDTFLVDKLYKVFSNTNFIRLLRLNSKSLIKDIDQARERILFILSGRESLEFDLDDLIEKVKKYCLICDEICELYLYDVFS